VGAGGVCWLVLATNFKEEQRMTADEFLIEIRVLVEQTCYPPFERGSGTQPPLTNEQWDTISDRVMLLAARNKVRSEK
jgi:hypothetical protein